jgi:hypothetical protein
MSVDIVRHREEHTITIDVAPYELVKWLSGRVSLPDGNATLTGIGQEEGAPHTVKLYLRVVEDDDS